MPEEWERWATPTSVFRYLSIRLSFEQSLGIRWPLVFHSARGVVVHFTEVQAVRRAAMATSGIRLRFDMRLRPFGSMFANPY